MLYYNGEWIGGATYSGPGGFGAEASYPFAVLRLEDGTVTLRLRGLGRLMRKTVLECPVGSLELAFPCHRILSQGVGLRAARGAEVYFWTSQGDEILRELKRLGTPMDAQSHRARLVP
ncbi:hypothetical protein KDL01_33360 [Actinospica durhamensis]|uniref:Uncharacterized protein n=1 Tax=Actinospica durhamensis TaxID=1508375 RepID=A0A941EZN2_9ACTN|nr:hypothetical protein [Actinospica durhamensis]MBR7838209.1 hypothetical protein [Actinospica durhamensis]